MDGTAQAFPAEKYEQIWPGRWRDAQVLLLLLTLALLLRGWSLWQTEVPARDSIGFIRYALRLENHPWDEVIKSEHQHPGYPVCVLFVSEPVRWFAGGINCYSMQLSAQIVSTFAGWLIVVPMFFLGTLLFGRTVSFWSVVLFQSMPVSGPVLSDAISDPLFLCLLVAGLWFAVRAVQGKALWPFALCGGFTGLAYLVRPEGALVVVATALVLLGMQFVPRWRRTWRSVAMCACLLFGSALVVGSPFYLTIHGFTTKPSAYLLTGQLEAELEESGTPQAAATACGPLFAVHIDSKAELLGRMGQGVRAIAAELAHAFQYFGWIPAVIGLWWCRDRYRNAAGTWVLVVLFVLHGILVWLLAVKVGYVSDRHILLLFICCLFQAVAVTLQIPFRLGDWQRARSERAAASEVPSAQINETTSPGHMTWRHRFLLVPAPLWALLLMVLCTGAGLSRSMRPLHGNRTGHHEAGRWLAQVAAPGDRIEDDHCWAHYYAGRVFREAAIAGKVQVAAVPQTPPVTYYVVSRANEVSRGLETRRFGVTPRRYEEKDLIARGGTIVFHWPANVSEEKAQVVIYRLTDGRGN